jgi:hypothetical protein
MLFKSYFETALRHSLVTKSTAMRAMRDQLLEIKSAVEKISEESLDPETKSTARSLLKNINYKFVCNLCV